MPNKVLELLQLSIWQTLAQADICVNRSEISFSSNRRRRLTFSANITLHYKVQLVNGFGEGLNFDHSHTRKMFALTRLELLFSLW